jgi:hypothetical protein
MKTLSFFSFGRQGYILGILNALLAIGLAVLSFRYIQPKDCYRSCTEGLPCPTGGCHFGEQKAGWPLPAFVDMPGGGSPTSGWGLLGPEDLPSFMPMILDVLFYSSLLACIGHRSTRSEAGSPSTARHDDDAVDVFPAVSSDLLPSFRYSAPINSSQRSVYIDTPTDRYAGLAFSPLFRF